MSGYKRRDPLPTGVAVADDGSYVRVLRSAHRCVCCSPTWQRPVLDALLLKYRGLALPNGKAATWQAMLDYIGLPCSLRAFRSHYEKHCEAGGKYVRNASDPDPDKPDILVREDEFRDAARKAIAGEPTVVDVRGSHIAFLENVVAIGAERIYAFPEQVTVEMALRASAELVKAKQNAERDELLKMLAASADRTPASLAKRGVDQVGRRIAGALEAAPVVAVVDAG